MQSTESNLFIRLGCLAPILGIVALFVLIRQDRILPAFLFFVLFFGIAVLFLYLSGRYEEKAKQKQADYLATFTPSKPSYTESHSFISFDLLSKLAVDDKNKRIYLWTPPMKNGKYVNKAYKGMPYEIKDYPFKDLLAVCIYENGMLKRADKKPGDRTEERLTALGQTVGDPAATKISAAKKIIHRKVATVEMKLIFDDADRPARIIRFYEDLDKRLAKKSADYRKIEQTIDQWEHLLTYVMESSQ